eukprot:298762-Rhodomonas_salina.1
MAWRGRVRRAVAHCRTDPLLNPPIVTQALVRKVHLVHLLGKLPGPLSLSPRPSSHSPLSLSLRLCLLCSLRARPLRGPELMHRTEPVRCVVLISSLAPIRCGVLSKTRRARTCAIPCLEHASGLGPMC